MYPRRVSRFNAWSLLAVFGIGVFLAGLELMITATALPSILLDLAISDQLGKPAFSELRHASWIVNGYLLAYIVAMPLAGRLADVWGARRLFLSALIVFILGSLAAGRAQTIDELIAGRIIQGIGGGILVPVGTAAASHLFEGDDRPRALGIIGALTFLGMAAGPFLGAAILGGLDVASGLARVGARVRLGPRQRPGAVVALGLLRQRPDRDHRPPRSPGRPRAAGRRRAATPGSTSSAP